VTLLLSAFATDAIGIHPVFGALLIGAITPRCSKLAFEMNKKK
jgi:Kef-type K+ transport system membrane component KefB